MFLKKSKRWNALLISTGIIAGLLLVYVAYVLLYGNKNQAHDPSANSETRSVAEVKMVTVPLKAEFTAHYTSIYEDVNRCGKLPFTRVIVDGTGTEPNLGKFTVHMDFCNEGGSGIYLDMVNSYLSIEGDSLFIIAWGQVKHPDENDPLYYTDKWDDPFEFTGGTGRFEGATGGGVIHGYNTTEDDLSHHTLEGTLTMKAE